jgi:hypothetical protein
LTAEEIEVWNMWVYKTHGILPNQYHPFYDEGSTLIYPEHIQDLVTVDKMWGNKLEMKAKKEQAKQRHKQNNNPLSKGQNKGLGSGGFYGNTFKYSK